MSIKRRAAMVVASLGITTGGLFLAAAPASASAQDIWTCNPPTYMTGSGGHAGASLQCFGTSWDDKFNVAVTCKRWDNGFEYRHDGNIVETGQVSTVWCDLNARIVHLAYVAW
ncbi:hypothetical protein AB4Z54_49670 [Streptomyces sp. MCAF7]